MKQCEEIFYVFGAGEVRCENEGMIGVTNGFDREVDYIVCSECAEHVHPSRLIELREKDAENE